MVKRDFDCGSSIFIRQICIICHKFTCRVMSVEISKFPSIFCLFVRTSLSCQYLLKQGKWKKILHFIFYFTGGRNVCGAKLCNIFSEKFTVETSCKTSKKCFRQVTYTVTINIYYHLSYTHVALVLIFWYLEHLQKGNNEWFLIYMYKANSRVVLLSLILQSSNDMTSV